MHLPDRIRVTLDEACEARAMDAGVLTADGVRRILTELGFQQLNERLARMERGEPVTPPAPVPAVPEPAHCNFNYHVHLGWQIPSSTSNVFFPTTHDYPFCMATLVLR